MAHPRSLRGPSVRGRGTLPALALAACVFAVGCTQGPRVPHEAQLVRRCDPEDTRWSIYTAGNAAWFGFQPGSYGERIAPGTKLDEVCRKP
jgi:hypothetical protein